MLPVLNKRWLLAVLVALLLVGCGNEATAVPTPVVEPTDAPTATAVPTNTAVPTEKPTATAMPTAVPTNTNTPRPTRTKRPTRTLPPTAVATVVLDDDALLERVTAGLSIQRTRTAVARYDGAFSFAYPREWVVIEAAETLTVTQQLAEGEEGRPSLIRFETIIDSNAQFDLISEGLLSETTVNALSDTSGQALLDALDDGDGDSADLFGETYVQWQRAVFQNDLLLLLTGECSVANRAQCQRIFDDVVKSMVEDG